MCLRRERIKFIVLFGLTNFGSFEPDTNQSLTMSNQESWHLVDECVISPLHSSIEVTPEDSVSQVDSGHTKALSRSSSSSSSSKGRRDAKIKASIASLQAKHLAE